MDILGDFISKCNGLSENIRQIKAIEVLYRLRNKQKQAGIELGQAQLKLELYYTLIFCRFGLIGISIT